MKTAWYKNEILMILLVWVLIYASDPLYMCYAEISSGYPFEWEKVFNQWVYTSAFFVLFLFHHFVLIPQLATRKKLGAYVCAAAVCLVAISLFFIFRAPPYTVEHLEHIPSTNAKARPPLLAPPDLARMVMAFMMIVIDLSVMAWFNDQKMRQRLLLLEKQNLKQELAHLRYQINPHFFMNTLNNIHALVDIDQERAKRAVVELSGLMRYALYEGNEYMVELNHEMEFLRLYISLMKLRYNDKVEIVCEMPEKAPTDVKMPPMLLATFVENAFKHGVSYRSDSYIHVHLEVDEVAKMINFDCSNSIHANQTYNKDGQHGIGLENVKKRLDLQYADRYQLTIDEQENVKYVVKLSLPTVVK